MAAVAANKKPLVVAITGAAGQIGYSLIPFVASGQTFGMDQPVSLRLIEIPFCVDKLKGIAMELEDCAYPLLREVRCVSTAEPEKGWSDIDYAILVGGFPRKKGMLRADLLSKNNSIFKEAGENLEKYAKETTKVLVVANPANTNCLVAATAAKKIPKENFCALTRLDYNRATGALAKKLKVSAKDLSNVVIWGNHSKSQVPDASFATVNGKDVVAQLDKEGQEWYKNEFKGLIQQRGASVIKARGASSAMSAANAAKDCCRDWHLGTKEGEHVAMSVWSNGNPYGIEDGIFYSFPCSVSDGKWKINEVKVDKDIVELMKASEKELLEERTVVLA